MFIVMSTLYGSMSYYNAAVNAYTSSYNAATFHLHPFDYARISITKNLSKNLNQNCIPYTSRPFSIGVDRVSSLPLATILTHMLRLINTLVPTGFLHAHPLRVHLTWPFLALFQDDFNLVLVSSPWSVLSNSPAHSRLTNLFRLSSFIHSP